MISESNLHNSILSQLHQQQNSVSSGGIFTVRIELGLFETFTFSPTLASWMLSNVSGAHNLWRRALFTELERQHGLWCEDQINVILTFDTLPVEPQPNLSSKRCHSTYGSLCGIITSVADPFVEMFAVSSRNTSYNHVFLAIENPLFFTVLRMVADLEE